VIQASSSGLPRHAQTPSSPVRTGAAGLPPLQPGPFEADHQLSDRLKRGPQQFWYSGRLARAGANSRLRGGDHLITVGSGGPHHAAADGLDRGLRHALPQAVRPRCAPPHRRLLQSPPAGLTAHGNGDVRRAPARSRLSCSVHLPAQCAAGGRVGHLGDGVRISLFWLSASKFSVDGSGRHAG
jgi:hypothetical protein